MSLDSLLAMPMKPCTDEEFEILKQRSANQYEFYYPVGNCPPMDVTHGCRIPSPCDVMLLGCGDIRYLLHTLNVLHDRFGATSQKPVLNFHLNDIEDGILARDLIFLYLIDTIDPGNDSDMKFLWSIWYEPIISKGHLSRLQDVMKHLEDVKSGDHGVYFGSDWTREKLVLDLKWMGKQKTRSYTVIADRKAFFLDSYGQKEFPQKPAMRVASRFTMQHTMFDDNPILKERLNEEIREYVEYGVTRVTGARRKRKELEREYRGNVTFYRPRSDVWKTQDNCSPFMCYNVDYEIEKYDGMATTMSALLLEKLKTWVRTYQTIRKKSWNLKVYLWLGDCVELCEEGLPESVKFDFLHTSNLADRIGIVPLLITCRDKLKRDKGVMTIESYQWSRMMNSVANTLTFCVDIPITLYPSVIGLHLVDDLSIGHERLLERGYFVGCGSLILTWRIAKPTSLLTITGSDDISKCIRAMVRPNTEQKKSAGPWQFQGVEVTKFDIPCRTKLLMELQKSIMGGGQRIAKVIEDFLMGSIPESLAFLSEEELSSSQSADPTPSTDTQRTVVEYNDKYDVTITCDESQMRGQFSCDQRDGDQHTVMYTFTEDGKVVFSNTISLACAVSLETSNIQVSRKRGVISSSLLKNPAMNFGERLLPTSVTKQKTVSKLPDFPSSEFARQLLSTRLFRIYPLENRAAVPIQGDFVLDQQVQDLMEFLMQTTFDNRTKAKVLCIPKYLGSPGRIGGWASVFYVEGLKIWEGKPTLFVTWYDYELARMYLDRGKIKAKDVEYEAGEVKPNFVLNDTGKYMMGYLTLVRILMTNSQRLEQEGPEAVRWKFRTFVRPRYKHLTFEVFRNEVNLSAKYGSFTGDPESIKTAMHKMMSDTGMDATLSDKDVEDIFIKSMKMNYPGYTGYGVKGSNPPSYPRPASGVGSNPAAGAGASSKSGAQRRNGKVPKDGGPGCDGCGKVSPDCRKCGGCGNVVYCNRDCQRNAWPRHKLTCKKVEK